MDAKCLGGDFYTDSVADQRNYPLDDTFFPPIIAVEYDYGQTTEKLLPFAPDWFSSQYNVAGSGTPECYTVILNGPLMIVRLLPAPDTSSKVLHVRAYALPNAMTDDSSTCELPTVFHDAVIQFGAYRAWLQWEEFENANAALNEYQMLVRQLRRGWNSPAGGYPLGAIGVIDTRQRSAIPPMRG